MQWPRQFFFAVTLLASVNVQAGATDISIVIEPRCSDEFFGPIWDMQKGGDLKGAEAERENKRRALPVIWDDTHAKPLMFKDPRSAITYRVGKDGRHLSAIGKKGQLLWEKDPFVEARLCPYRSPHPIIYDIQAAERGIPELANNPRLRIDPRDRYVEIRFDSSQFGVVNERTGRFTFLGQN